MTATRSGNPARPAAVRVASSWACWLAVRPAPDPGRDRLLRRALPALLGSRRRGQPQLSDVLPQPSAGPVDRPVDPGRGGGVGTRPLAAAAVVTLAAGCGAAGPQRGSSSAGAASAPAAWSASRARLAAARAFTRPPAAPSSESAAGRSGPAVECTSRSLPPIGSYSWRPGSGPVRPGAASEDGSAGLVATGAWSRWNRLASCWSVRDGRPSWPRCFAPGGSRCRATGWPACRRSLRTGGGVCQWRTMGGAAGRRPAQVPRRDRSGNRSSRAASRGLHVPARNLRA